MQRKIFQALLNSSRQQELISEIRGIDYAVDVSEDDKNVYVDMHMPGVEKETVSIEIHNHQLRVSGDRKESKVKGSNYFAQEINRGHFIRLIDLPAEVQEENAWAEIKNGEMKLILIKKKVKKAKIKIK